MNHAGQQALRRLVKSGDPWKRFKIFVSRRPRSFRHDKRVKTLRDSESRGDVKERSTKEVKVRGYATRLFKRVKGKLLIYCAVKMLQR